MRHVRSKKKIEEKDIFHAFMHLVVLPHLLHLHIGLLAA